MVATSGRMSAAEAQRYDAQMNNLDLQLKAIGGGPAGGNVAECFGDCDELYPGKGNGQGWKRFTCKSACILTNIF